MNDRDYEKLLAQVMHLDGGWLAPYCDPSGNLIVAADHHGLEASNGVERMTLLEWHVRRVALDLEDILPGVGRLDAVRQRVLIHMAFNMGVERLQTRLRFISAVQFRFWEAAALEMMFSDWAKQEQRRADVLAEMMRTGRDEPAVGGRAEAVGPRH